MLQRILYRSILLVMLSSLVSCKAYTPVVSQTPDGPRTSTYKPLEDYIYMYKDMAVSEMKRTGVPASITLAQGMIESDYGRSRLAREANNHFGIKCHNWTGDVTSHNDNRKNECFRKYNNPEESFRDHSEFLRNGSRYQQLFRLDPADYKGWARGLIKAGYATNPDYANMLIKKIEENQLWQYDRDIKIARTEPPSSAKVPADKTVIRGKGDDEVMAASSKPVLARAPRIMENNRIQYIIVKDGDTKEYLEKEFGLLRWELPKYNDLNRNFSMKAGQILYLQPKREKAEPGKDYHIVNKDETMHDISQKYGIKLKTLYEMNRMDQGAEPEQGRKIWLRGMKPVI